MCGRYNLTASSEAIVGHFQLQRQVRSQTSYNIAPTQKILNIVVLEDQSKKAVNLFWGLVPSWAKDSKNSSHLINARSETVREKPSFRSVFKHRRCLIPATGFYEWIKTDVVDQINRRFPKAISIAATGFYKSWKPKAEQVSQCYTTGWRELVWVK